MFAEKEKDTEIKYVAIEIVDNATEDLEARRA